MTCYSLLLLLTNKTWEQRYIFHVRPWLGAMAAGGLGPAGLGRSSCARSVGGRASPARGEFGEIPTGRKSCRGGWISGPFLGLENVPHTTRKTIKRKTKAWSLLCRRQDQFCPFSGSYHGFHGVCCLISMLSFWSLVICENRIYVNVFGHSTYPEANLCVPGERRLRWTASVGLCFSQRHYADAVADMWSFIF